MTDRPILFSAPMVRALLAGTKTQTRRVLTKPYGTFEWVNADWRPLCLKFFKGDRLYVREAWRCNGWASDVATIMYRASEGDGYTAMTEQYPADGKQPLRVTGTWRPGIHMPRWASRLTLTVTEVRVQRLQEISEEDARSEGAAENEVGYWSHDGTEFGLTAKDSFAGLWHDLNAARGFGWDQNPWVVALSFSVLQKNIDAPNCGRAKP
ncbi:hypothetical protein [Mesorhizobium sp. AD1-1]|uniref:hypothetical protein n=1 Tax=Mesorhizobium sp. AD1-1 TaxID=2876621 RepID=UPI00398C4B44